MGDHRCSVKIKFEMHGVKKQCDMYINWYENSDGIDQRIFDFFRESVDEAMDVYETEMIKYRREQLEILKEENDKIEYARLKKKYEGL